MPLVFYVEPFHKAQRLLKDATRANVVHKFDLIRNKKFEEIRCSKSAEL